MPMIDGKHVHTIDISEDSIPDMNSRVEERDASGNVTGVFYDSLDTILVRCNEMVPFRHEDGVNPVEEGERPCGWQTRIIDAKLGEVARWKASGFRGVPQA